LIRAILATVILATTISLAIQVVRWTRLIRTEPAKARELRSAVFFWLLLVVGLALGYPEFYFFVDRLLGVPSLPQLLQHLAAVGIAYQVVNLVFRTVLPEDRARRSARAWGIALGFSSVGLITFYLLGPLPNRLPLIASQYADSPWVVEYQMIVVAFLGLASGALFWIGTRYRRHAARGPLRVALRLLQIGGGLSMLSMLHRFGYLVVVSAGGHLPWYETGADGIQLYLTGPALLCILAGITMPRWGPRLLSWRRHRRWYRQLRPLWIVLYRVDQDIAFLPFRPVLVEALTVTRMGFRLHRRVVEIRDVLIGPLRGHLDPAVLNQAKEQAAALPEPERAAVAEAVCIAAAVRAHEQNMPRRQDSSLLLHTETTDLDGEAAWLATVSQAMSRSSTASHRHPGPDGHRDRHL